jgi:hypothetical protein
LPRRYQRHCWYFTDLFRLMAGVLPRWRAPLLNGGGTNIIEGHRLISLPALRRAR